MQRRGIIMEDKKRGSIQFCFDFPVECEDRMAFENYIVEEIVSMLYLKNVRNFEIFQYDNTNCDKLNHFKKSDMNSAKVLYELGMSYGTIEQISAVKPSELRKYLSSNKK